ncbi:MAG TPA: polysaccharide pyruvyl transferase CsaB, partial [Candidatus Baltobacteraceae bacterium]|nr:polysaccharide pyruvyl transferase CsaB [Candidatus Baltobacteraceae bacterium]
ISGYYGFGNLGDEALLAIIVSQLKRRYPLASIDVLSENPGSTAHDYGVEATPRWEQGAIRRAIERADTVLSGGGGLLQNATSLKSLLYYAGIIRTAIRARKRTMVFAQSVGPLDFWGKQTVRECCRGLSAATVRDERSRELFAPLVPGVAVERTADPVFLYDPPAAGIDLTVAGLGPESDPLVVACVRKTAHWNEGVVALAAAVDRLASEHGARTAFVPFGGAADAEAATSVIRKCRSKPTLVPLDGLDAVAAAIARARLVIGVRLHALILAMRFGVPFLAVPYDPKVRGLCEDAAYPLAPLWTPGVALAPGEPVHVVDEAWRRRDELATFLERSAQLMRERAAYNFDVLAQLTERPSAL